MNGRGVEVRIRQCPCAKQNAKKQNGRRRGAGGKRGDERGEGGRGGGARRGLDSPPRGRTVQVREKQGVAAAGGERGSGSLARRSQLYGGTRVGARIRGEAGRDGAGGGATPPGKGR